MKRLLCIVGSLNVGGAETFMMKIMRQTVGTDYHMDFVVATQDRGYYEDEVEAKGEFVYHIDLHRSHPIKSYNALKKIVRDNKYKYVIKLSNTPLGVIDLWAAKAGGAQRVGVRSCNAITNESNKSKILNEILRLPFNWITDYKIAPSNLAAEYTFGKKQVEQGNVCFLHNAVDMNVYKYSEDSGNAVRHEFKIEGNLVIGHVGRFCTQKNHMFLLDIFKKITDKRSDAVLVLVGNGELQPKIRQKAVDLGISDRVIFTGIRADIPQIMSAMDVFLLPSLYEGMPNTVIEAQATGLPCIIADTITNQADITGLVQYLPLSDPEIWAESTIAALRNERMETRQYFIDNEYDIVGIAKKFFSIVFEE